MEVHFGLGLHDRAVVHASYHNVILAATRPGTTGACGAIPGNHPPRTISPGEPQTKLHEVSYTGKHPQSRIREVDKSRLCGNSLPIEPIARPLWVGADLGGKNPA